MKDENKLIKLEVVISEIEALGNVISRLPKADVPDVELLKAISLLNALATEYELADEVGALEKPKRILSKVKEVEHLNAVIERLKWKIRGLMAIPILHGGMNFYTTENNTAAAMDLLYDPDEVPIHCTSEHSGEDFMVKPRSIIAIESDGKKKTVFLKSPVRPLQGGTLRYKLELENDMESLLQAINRSSQAIVMRISNRYAVNIFEYVFSKPGKFVFAGEKLDPKFKLKKELDIDSKFDPMLYHKATSEFENYQNLTSLFLDNMTKMRVINERIKYFQEFYGKEIDKEESINDKKETDFSMNILKIINGKVEIRKDSGSLVRTIGNGDAINADFNTDQSLVAITTVKGKVEIRKENGSLIRTIGNGDASSVRWHGLDLAISTTKGKTELRKENGSLIRTI